MSQQRIIANRFKLEEIIGYGGMGEVYRAVDEQTGQLVAVKRLKPELVKDEPNFVRRFTLEGEALSQLNHPNIVGMISAFTVDDDHYLVMEYVGGGSLADLLAQRKRLSVRRSLEIALDLNDALTRAHRLNIIHRDIKPSNVLLAEDGTPRLTDFGTARIQQGKTQLTGTGVMVGTYAYMSPEACNGDALDARTDIWSFGVMLYEMLTGQLPFNHPQLVHLLMSIMTEPPPDIQELRPEISDDLADLIYRMLVKDADRRISTTRLVGVALEANLQGEILDEPVASGRLRTPARVVTTTYIRTGPARHNLPVIATPFVGRDAELAEINRLLADPDCRLLTLHGPGGIGKTRLAIEAGISHLGQFQHGVYFVDLTTIQEDELVAPAIGDAIRFGFFGHSEPEIQLLDYLQNKEMLLILDNFEHLMEKADFLFKVLHTAPEVRMLVTSRGRLNLREEWLLPLEGLPLPQQGMEKGSDGATAVDFFLQSARRIRPNFSPNEEDLQAIYAICRLVGGSPLGIELAASWVNTLTPPEIVAEISDDFDFLTTSLRDLPARHQSVRSVFDYSWKLLKKDEKRVLARLSVFRGGFDRKAAHTVTRAPLLFLNTLIDKSLLQRSPASGRYNLQELLRQFAAEKLAELTETATATQKQHAYYYLHYIQDRHNDLVGGRQSEALSEIDHEIDNVRTAWQWAVAERDEEAFVLGLDPLYHFYLLRGRQREGADVLAQAVRALRAGADGQSLTLARALARQGACSRFIGRLEEAKALLEESLQIVRALDDKREIAFALYHLGATDPADPSAQSYWEESLALAEEIGDQMLVAEALNWLAFVSHRQGEFDAAVDLLQQSLKVRRSTGDHHGLATCLTNLGTIYAYLGENEKAQALLLEGLQTYEQLNDLHGMAAACNNLSYIAINARDYGSAQEWAEQALTLLREVGDKRGEGQALGNLSEVAYYQEEYERARAICRQGIKLYEAMGLSTSSFHNDLGRLALAQAEYAEAQQELRRALTEDPNPYLTLDILTNIAAVQVRTGELEQAVALLTFVKQNEASEPLVKERAHGYLTELAEMLPPDRFALAENKGGNRTLVEWVEAVQN
jgi:predicted ATPase/predicted Ser/Thr protein kinase/Flp pilus assembly protein TadD